MRARLNLNCLRTRRIHEAPANASAASPASRALSRRGFLELGGAVALTPLAFESLLVPRSKLRFSFDGRVARFYYGQRELWKIDPSDFAGRPKLRVEETRDRIGLSLRGARLPGTRVIGDFECVCRKSRLGWTVALELAAGGFSATGPLEAWLLGEQILESEVLALGVVARQPSGRFLLEVSGKTRGQFRPSWRLHLTGPGICSASTREWSVDSDEVEIGLPRTDHASIVERPSRLRSRIQVTRGKNEWVLWPLESSLSSGVLKVDRREFDDLEIEVAESPAGKSVAYLARAASQQPRSTSFFPGPAFRGNGGSEASFGLTSLRLAGLVSGKDGELALLANLGADPTELEVASCGFLLGDSEVDSVLEITQENGLQTRFKFAPVLLASLVPLDGVLVEPSLPDRPTRMALLEAPSRQGIEGACAFACDSKNGAEVVLPNLRVSATRPEDLLVLEFEFRNLKLRKGLCAGLHLESDCCGPPLVIVHFPPQHLAEQAFFEAAQDADSEMPTRPPVQTRVAGRSRLVFDPRSRDSAGKWLPLEPIPFTLDTLLEWSRWTPVRVDDIRKLEKIEEPTAIQTDIEFPYRLHLSPNAEARWRHASLPVARNGRYELWHSRLSAPYRGAAPPTLRAVWSPDFSKTGDPNAVECPFRMSLNNRDRHQIVRVTHELGREPVAARLFMLSSMGAWSDIEGNWPCTPGQAGPALERWLHVATMGRDQNVVIERRGFLFPLGHRATLVKQTERKLVLRWIQRDGVKRPVYVAYLRQKKYIQIKEISKDYSPWYMGWRRVSFLEERSPNLNDPLSERGGGVPTSAGPAVPPAGCPSHWGERAFWPTVGDAPHKFKVRTWDWTANSRDVELPLIFVENSGDAVSPEVRTCSGDLVEEVSCPPPGCTGDQLECEVRDAARDYDLQVDRATVPVGGSALALAPSYRKGDTEVEAANIRLGYRLASEWSPDPTSSYYLDCAEFEALDSCAAPFWPRFSRVEAKVPAIDYMAGDGGQAWFEPRCLELSPEAEVFASIVEGQIKAPFHESSDRSGGLLAPTPEVAQLSRRFGPGKFEQLPAGRVRADAPTGFDPKAFFGNGAKILGEIALSEIVAVLDPNGSVPALVSTMTPYADGPDFLEQALSWSTTNLQDQDFGLLQFFANQKGDPAKFTIDGSIRVWLGSEVPPAFEMRGLLERFSIRLGTESAGVLIEFPSLTYSAGTHRKPDLDVKVGEVSFLGALAFIQTLATYLGDLLGKKTGVELELQPRGVLIRFPPLTFDVINIGAMSLKGLSITSWAKLPFVEAPVEFGLNFARPEAPCTLTAGIYGGRAYVTLVLDTAHGGIRDMAAAFEFGVIKEVSFGPAHGQVYILGGIFFGIRSIPSGRVVELRAYVRAGGNVDVLGLITAYIDLYVGLLAQNNGSESYLLGEASLTIGFKVAIVEHKATLRRSERIAGSKTGKSERRVALPPGVEVLGVYASLNSAGYELDAPPIPRASEVEEQAQGINAQAMINKRQWAAYWAAFAPHDGAPATRCLEPL